MRGRPKLQNPRNERVQIRATEADVIALNRYASEAVRHLDERELTQSSIALRAMRLGLDLMLLEELSGDELAAEWRAFHERRRAIVAEAIQEVDGAKVPGTRDSVRLDRDVLRRFLG